MYHGIVLDAEFNDPTILDTFKIFSKRKSLDEDWILYGVEVEDSKLKETVKRIQSELKSEKPYYVHFYNDKKLIVIFKEKIFYASPHRSTWKEILEYGKKLNIPNNQLNIWPYRFQEEIHYFKEEDFVNQKQL